MIELHSLGEIKDDVLFHTCEIKNYNGFYKKVSGPTAKYFACYNSAYGYPLFKTHKLNKDQLLEVDILDIPRKFLQSAGDITTSRTGVRNVFFPVCQFVKFNVKIYVCVPMKKKKGLHLNSVS